MKMFCVYDSKVESYMHPMFFQHRGEMLRAWSEAVNDPKTQFCRYPSDFTLFEIGSYDERSGEVKMLDAKLSLGLALEFKNNPTGEIPVLQAIENAKKEGN